MDNAHVQAARIIFSGANAEVTHEKINRAAAYLSEGGLRDLRSTILKEIGSVDMIVGTGDAYAFTQKVDAEIVRIRMEQDRTKKILEAASGRFSPAEYKRVKLLFGFGEDGKIHTPKEVSNMLTIPYQTVLSTQRKAQGLIKNAVK